MNVGFFSNGIDYSLPHPSIPKRTILIICKVLDRAWNLLIENPPEGFHFLSADEDLITTHLKSIIENRLRKHGEVSGFNSKTFGRVQRDAKVSNYNGNHLDKMPDIFFDLKRDDLLMVINEYDGLFVECKPVDKNHPVGSCYIQKGLIRFINGDYAWAMQEGMMIAYSCQNYPLAKLEIELKSNKQKYLNTLNYSTLSDNTISQSKHKRIFDWPEKRGTACPINVYHLWKFKPGICP